MSEHDQVRQLMEVKAGRPLVLDSRTTALAVVDVQRLFVHREYAFMRTFEALRPGATEGYRDRAASIVVPNIARLQERFRSYGAPVFYTATGTRVGDGRDLPCWLRDLDDLSRHALGTSMWPTVGDPAWEIEDAVAPRAHEQVLHKTSSGAFSSTQLDQVLRTMAIDSVVVTGLTTDVCVSSTAREAADRGFRVIVVSDACTTLSEHMHRGALEPFALALGRVARTDEVIAALTDVLPPPPAEPRLFAASPTDQMTV